MSNRNMLCEVKYGCFVYLLQESILSFKYSIMEETDSAIGGSWAMDETQLKTFRTILVVPASRMDNILKDIQSNLASWGQIGL